MPHLTTNGRMMDHPQAPPPAPARVADPLGPPIVYVSSNLPSRSQTFVYQEIHGLRALGAHVLPTTVRRNPFMSAIDLRLGAVTPLVDAGLHRSAARALLRNPRGVIGVAREIARGPLPDGRARLRTAWHAWIGLRLADYARANGAGYIHAHHADVPTTVAMVAGAAAGVPYGFTAHAADVFSYPSLVDQKARRASAVIAASERVAERVAELSPASAERVRVVRCGVPLERFRHEGERAPGDALRLLTVGRLMPQKDHLSMVAACAELARRGVAFELRIVGEGAMRDEIAAAIDAAGLAERITLVGGLPNQELPALYGWADAFILSSLREGMPVVLAEALAAGLPVASTWVDGIPELIRDGVDGLLVPPDEPARLADAIARLTDPELRAALAAAGVERARVHDLIDVAASLTDAFPVPRLEPPDPRPSIADPLPVTVAVIDDGDAPDLARAVVAAARQEPRPPAQVLVISSRRGPAEEIAEAHGARLAPPGEMPHNAALASAAHPWLVVIGAGDEMLPHQLAVLWQQRRDRDLVLGACVVPDRPERVRALHGPATARPRVLDPARLIDMHDVTGAAALVRVDAARDLGGYRYSAGAEDLDLWVRLAERRGAGAGVATAVAIDHRPRLRADQRRRRDEHLAARFDRQSWWSPRSARRRKGARLAHGLVEDARALRPVAAVRRLAAASAAPGALGGAFGELGRRRRARRRGRRIAADGGPAVALLPSVADRRERAEDLMAGRPLVDLTRGGRLLGLMRMAARRPAMAFVDDAREALLARALGVRPLRTDRGESQTRGSARDAYGPDTLRAEVSAAPASPDAS